MFGSAMINMPPQPGLWTIYFERDLKRPGIYSLRFRDATGTVYSGPHYLRFETPDSAAGYISAWTELEESEELTQLIADGHTVETTGHSDVWLPVVYSLYHSAGPIVFFNASAFWADGGHQSARIPQDPEQEMPEDCDLLLRAHERDDRGILVSPNQKKPDLTIVWSSFTWKKSISNIYHPVVKVRFESGDTKTFTLLRGPYRRNSDKAILIPTKRGEYRIEWEESPDLAGSAKQQEKPTKSFTKVPANYSELSEEERKQWTAEAALAIRASLRDRKRDGDTRPQR
jgi:hypothetical protein